MRIEIKKISILSLLFSALPLAIFGVMLIGSFFEIFMGGEGSLFGTLMSAVFRAIVNTLLAVISVLIGAFIYNLLCAIGLKGLRLDLEDVTK